MTKKGFFLMQSNSKKQQQTIKNKNKLVDDECYLLYNVLWKSVVYGEERRHNDGFIKC